jgi:flagellar biosynthesis protein FliR
MQIRIFACMAFSLSLAPVVQPMVGQMPNTITDLVLATAGQAASGIILGLCLHLVVFAFQMAGTLLDVQVGFSSVSVFNPLSQQQITLLGNLKMWLAIVLLMSFNGHHLIFRSLVESYGLTLDVELGRIALTSLISKMSLLALQIAAPVAAAALIVDVASGFINKTIPQMQVYIVAMPAKMILGVTALMLSLPMLAGAVNAGVEHAYEELSTMFVVQRGEVIDGR